ncbi:MAG: outer membrane lipoprotein-sorting protein [Candidatus Anammoxibacter sp.]
MKKSYSLFIVLFLVFYSSILFSQEEDTELPTGEEVVKKLNSRDEGESVSRTIIMKLIDRSGKKRLRETRGFRKYYGDEKRTVIFYTSPRNIKDTALLTIDYAEPAKDDDQWLYMPALRKVRRISASNRGDYFLGTDFTYEDLKKESKIDLNDYNVTTVGEGVVDDHRCYIVEGIPVDNKIAKELGYGKVHQWVDVEIWMTRKSIMWDLKGNLLKTIKFSDIRNVQNIWTVHEMVAENHKTGHRTIFTFKDVDYKNTVEDSLFTEQALRRGF